MRNFGNIKKIYRMKENKSDNVKKQEEGWK